MKKVKPNSIIVFISICIIIGIIFIIYFFSNIKPSKINYNFKNISEETNFINNYKIEDKNGRIAIYFDIKSDIFKEYNYYSYISGKGNGRKINLETYLISDDKSTCYKIKTNCYDYTDTENLKFIGYYYDNFIKNENYKLAFYVVETDTLYMTNIEI